MNLTNFVRHRPIRQTIRIMKVIVILITTLLIQVSATTRAQITLIEKNAALEKVIKSIKKQSGYDFFYNGYDLKKAKQISLNLTNVSLEQALEPCLKDQNLTYSIDEKTVVIKEKEKSFLDRLIEAFKAIDVSGKIVDEKGDPVAGATIRIKGTFTQTNSGSDGYFSLKNVADHAIIEITYVGYQAREVKAAKDLGSIRLEVEVGKLEEVNVVNTGYQSLAKERATGSFTVIDNKTLDRTVSSDLLSRLKGVTNGLLFDNNTGNATGISVRGRSTIFSNTTPLIIVDNFPFEGDLNTLNPDVIENVTVLKDAAAASIWGVRAGNGVIVMTTKKGRLNTTPSINFNANLTVGEKPDLHYMPQMSSSEYIDIEKFLFDKGAYNATINNGWGTISPVVSILQNIRLNPSYAAQGNSEIDALRNIDVRDQLSEHFYQQRNVQHYAADVSGGGKIQSYFFSVGYDKNTPNLVAQSDDRLTLKGNNSYLLLNDRLNIHTDITFSKSKTDNLTGGYTPLLPYEQIADANGNALPTLRIGGLRSSYLDNLGNNGLLDWHYRPLEELRNRGSSQLNQLTDYRLNLGLNYKFIKSLAFALNYQYYHANNKIENNNDKDSFYSRNLVNMYSSINATTGEVTRPIPYGGIYNPVFVNRQSNYGRAQLNFNEVFKGKHQVSAIAGYEIRDDNVKRNSYTVYGYRPETGNSAIVDQISLFPIFYNPNSNQRISAPTNQSGSADHYISMYGNATYTFDQKYIVSGSYRKDESNLFGVKANQKGVPLWSAGLAWNVHKESFFNLDWLPSLQLKASYGYNGNVNNTISAYLTASSSTYNSYGVLGFAIVNPPNENLRWERVKNGNIGLYFSTRNNWVTGSMEYFEKSGVDLIASSPIAPQTGITLFTGNAADTYTKGVDVQLNTKNIDRGLKWNSTIIFNYVKDKITDYKVAAGNNASIVAASTYSLSPLAGYPINSIFGYAWAGLNNQGNPQGYLDGEISTDYTAIRNSNDRNQLQFLGSATPNVFGSLRNTFAFKSLELSFNVSYKFNYYFRRSSLSNGSIFSGTYRQRDYDKRWQNPGDELTTNVPALVYPNVAIRTDFYQNSAILIEKGDHIRLQDIQLNYTLSRAKIAKLPFSNINLYAYATNLGLLWKASKQDIDPDFRIAFPNPRSIAFGIKTNF